MKKFLTTLFVGCFVMSAFAQEWNPNGDNSMKGNLSVGERGRSGNTVEILHREAQNAYADFSIGALSTARSIIRGQQENGHHTNLQFHTTAANQGPKERMRIDYTAVTIHELLKAGIISTPNLQAVSARIGDPYLHSGNTLRIAHGDRQNASADLSIGSSATTSSLIRSQQVNGNHTNLQFHTTVANQGPVERMRIDVAGYVGIGTTTPSVHLDVAGTIKARKVVVEVPKGADFVFDTNYNLRPLSEVESFIRENKHLPEVQSEKNMQENGLNMNEFQIKLLQKVEELTLYIIQQDKRIQELEAAQK